MSSAVQNNGKIARFWDFYKISSRSEKSQTGLGAVITWVITIVQKNVFVATATCLEGVDLLPRPWKPSIVILNTFLVRFSFRIPVVSLEQEISPWDIDVQQLK